MEQKDFFQLAAKVADGKASDEELMLYAAIYEYFQQDISSWDTDKYGDEQQLRTKLESRLRPAPAHRLWPRIAIAASLLLSISAGGYFILSKTTQQPSHNIASGSDIIPGRNQATLILANGKQVILTKHLNGQIAVQGQTNINVQNGQLIYQSGAGKQGISSNTLATGRGEQSPYPIVLADGTKVWLNAQSRLTFPTAFNGKERIVKLIGEAYFEVKHKTAQPFKIYTAGGIIEDIGTRFNVNAYPDEKQEATTLLEGAVKITAIGNSQLLKPGEQAKYHQGNFIIRNVDPEEAIAWKNGYFMFTDVTLLDAMRQISRWYDVDIQFEDESLKQLTFVASITRFTNISMVLKILEMTKQVHFKIEGRVIKVCADKAN